MSRQQLRDTILLGLLSKALPRTAIQASGQRFSELVLPPDRAMSITRSGKVKPSSPAVVNGHLAALLPPAQAAAGA
ncbi:hypothetical protein GUJ93_ZPchr0003g18370 [Zizania palustris]|uniref:Uncharacterized protein n=1 Tax=Zizania palustris TaxID=103762 RepID=A0A8J5SCY5_ZIZPA|nr:hypothetical protein GUJ93_ZPchr0003g18370 [Zizania palustris]